MRSFGFALLGVAILLVLFFAFKPQDSRLAPTTSPNPLATSALSPAVRTQTQAVSLVLRDKKRVSGPETITVKQGDTIAITVTNDTDEELHLHGYDKKLNLVKDTPATLILVADKTGHFEYELEQSGTPIGALDVQP